MAGVALAVEGASPEVAATIGVIDILPALKREDSHGTVPLDWDIVVYDVARS
ncbi:hypothetical protein PM023_14730 [Halorubrum ezzemoulense]|jgi:hypothetical protein|uniref:hypothetical protein n=1 Tax=Halorubrum ezzemoulense TaxID=337243 RepID=UPI002330B030|nr:hypothetical protein [Halorubrum ezzemoulense]MDB2225921.1 hypothetical protein [Halorubrum ezzemoulense]MDB2272443.1 hypothetical protein [Halorubrum ezzemoulense]MDB2276437.1 hypothetical protein [Halorubrum ezzemoulense]